MDTKRNLVNWFEIYVQDMDRARTFYENILEIKMDKLENTAHEMWSFPMDMMAPGAGGSLIKIDGVPSAVGGTLIYFSTTDCDKSVKNTLKYGGTVVKDKESIGEYGFIALVKDTEGNMIGFHSLS